MMGFNKRYVNEENIRKVYEEGGYDSLVDYIRKPDALMVSDEFSGKIVDLMIEGDSELRIKTLMK
jgi:hypothetical protein